MCQQCGETLVDKHQYKKTVVEAATCTDTGIAKFTCPCGASYTEETPETGHTYEVIGTADACQTCSACNDTLFIHEPEYRNANGVCQHYCTICDYVFFDTEHILETKTTAATCGTDGLEISTCLICKEVISETVIPATGKHKIDTRTTEPTCTEDGFSIEFCKICNQEFRTLKWKKATGHNGKTEIVAEATCGSAGLRITTCANCNEVIEREEIPPTGNHTTETIIIPATCIDYGRETTVCTVCGTETHYIEIKPIPENHTIEIIVTEPTCVQSGLSKEVCKFCEKEFSRKILPAETENHTKESQIIEPTCAETGLERIVCTVCNAEFSRKTLAKTNAHTPTSSISAATCGQPGVALTWCKVCNAEIERVETPATGKHTAITELTEATCARDGLRITKCQVCNKELNRTILPATGRHKAEADDGDPATPVRCTSCGKTLKQSAKKPQDIIAMNELAFEIFKTIRSICIPLAILSFASCGWKFLGSIFFGNYVSMAGTDMMKAQKQLVMTILAVLFIVLFPRIYGVAITLFQEGFANGDGTIFKPWTPGGS